MADRSGRDDPDLSAGGMGRHDVTLDKVYALLEWDDIGDVALCAWEKRFLNDIAAKDELGCDVWSENQSAKVDEIYIRRCP